MWMPRTRIPIPGTNTPMKIEKTRSTGRASMHTPRQCRVHVAFPTNARSPQHESEPPRSADRVHTQQEEVHAPPPKETSIRDLRLHARGTTREGAVNRIHKNKTRQRRPETRPNTCGAAAEGLEIPPEVQNCVTTLDPHRRNTQEMVEGIKMGPQNSSFNRVAPGCCCVSSQTPAHASRGAMRSTCTRNARGHV